MKGALFLAAFVGLPLVGGGAFLYGGRNRRRLPLGGALASAAATGAVVLTAEMFAWTVVGVRWSLVLLLAVPAVAIVVAAYPRAAGGRVVVPPPDPWSPAAVGLLLIAAVAIAIAAYAALTARVTSSDLLLFWGAKGERFGLARAIDVEFLGRADHRLMHADYPPLWPCLNAFGTMLAGRFAWGASLATLPLFLLLSVIAVASFARPRLGSLEAAGLAAAFASIFGFFLSEFLTAGNADPPLLFFETLALCLLVFARDEPGAFLLAGVALAGATWLKLEGIAFGWAVIAAALLTLRPMSRRQLAQLASPPLIAYGTWIAFCRAHDLLDTLGSHRYFVAVDRVRTIAAGMLRAAGMASFYLPWVLVALLLVLRRPGRAAIFPILAAALIAAFDSGFYLASIGDPTPWIAMAGPRTLMTPLMALLLAAMAPRGATGSGERRGAEASSRP